MVDHPEDDSASREGDFASGGEFAGEGASVPPCPHCGEPVDTYPDPGGGDVQDYIEDCAVCCRPLRILAHRARGLEEFAISVEAAG